MPRAFDAKSTDLTVDAELDGLTKASIVDLRKRYREFFRTDPPKAFGRDLLRRSIAHKIQENAYGGLSRPTQRMLGQLVKASSSKPNGKLDLPRRIKPGSELVRIWKGNTYRVVVQAEGFFYEGKTYAGLSEIASLIAGSRWNGPRFFGLRSKSEQALGHGK
ncbi:MAG TPA: DUF2924 domain-containing protein [Afipia sp.]